MSVDFDVRGQQGMDFFTGGSDSMDLQTPNDKKKNSTRNFSSQDINWDWTGVFWITCGLLWCFYQLFGLSFWRHPFTGSIGKQKLSKSIFLYMYNMRFCFLGIKAH